MKKIEKSQAVIYSPDPVHPSVAELFHLAEASNLKISLIESSVGGLISHLIVRKSGASKIFKGCLIPYSNDVKEAFVNIPESGAVSEKFTEEIAEKWRKMTGADISLAESSILGPTGGTPQKPVGLSFISVSSEKGKYTFVNVFKGKRGEIMKKIAYFSLFVIQNHIIGWNLRKVKVASTFVEREDGKILLLKRSSKVGSYRGRWGVVSGHIEEGETPHTTSLKELSEEAGIEPAHILDMVSAKPFEVSDKKLSIRWEIYPLKVKVKKDIKVKIDWEHTKFMWINPENIVKLRTAPLLYQGFLKTLFCPSTHV